MHINKIKEGANLLREKELLEENLKEIEQQSNNQICLRKGGMSSGVTLTDKGLVSMVVAVVRANLKERINIINSKIKEL